MNKRFAIALSAVTWFVMGFALFALGMKMILRSAHTFDLPNGGTFPLLGTLSLALGGKDYAVVAIVAAALFVGRMKGVYVLQKRARKIAERIKGLEEPISAGRLYTPSYFALIGAMMLLGVAMNLFNLVSDVRGLIDLTVGTALIHGAIAYRAELFKSSS